MQRFTEVSAFIDGKPCTTGGRMFENRYPVDDSVNALVPECGADEVDRAVTAARRALRGPWGKTSPEERARILHRVADLLERYIDTFIRAEVLDTGKPRRDAELVDLPRSISHFRFYADLVKNIPTKTYETALPHGGRALNYVLRVPRGVVAIVCPWNVPLLMATWKIAPALACGNTVVVKPSELSPTSVYLLGQIMNEAGVPPGVYNVVQGFGPGSAGEMLCSHPGVDGITFTGESRTGAAIMKAAADGIRPVSFELGGKNAAILFADCDVEAALATLGRAVLFNCGQVCFGTERLYVERPLYERVVQGMAEQARRQVLGDPFDAATTMGPLISAEQRDKVLSYYDRAVADGANVVTGGGVPDLGGDLGRGYWVQPTVWTDLPEGSAVVREEIFGPCCRIAPFDDEDEVVALANDTEYGLATSIWTRDIARAHRMAASVEVGLSWINSWFVRDLRTPVGGAKQSGLGREGGEYALDFYTELRNVCVSL